MQESKNKSSHNNFEEILDLIADPIIVFGEHLKVVFANKACDQLGVDHTSLVGQTIHEMDFLNQQRPWLAENLQRRMNSEEIPAYDIYVPVVGKEGQKIRHFEVKGKRTYALGSPVDLVILHDITERKKSQDCLVEKLEETEKRYRALFDKAPLGVSLVDTETAAFVEFNDVTHTQLGYSREEFSKLRLYDIEGSESSEQVDSHIREILLKGEDEFETKHKTKNGSLRDVLVTVKVVEFTGKTFLHVMFHDITEIRRVQDALMESEASYRQLVELAHEGICALNTDFKAVFVNPRMAQMLGYAQSEIIGKSLFDFIKKSDVEAMGKFLAGFTQGVTGQFDYSFPRKDGTYVETSITASPIKDDAGNSYGTLALVTDITEKKRLEDELRGSEEKFRAISTSAMDAIVLLNQEGNIMYWNPAAEKILGYSVTEATGKNLTEMVIPPNAQKKHASMLKKNAKGTFSKHFEHRATRKDGTSCPIDISITSVKLKDKDCILGIIRDISERKAMEEALKQERDMLETMAENIGAGITIINRDYRIVWANRLLSGGEHLENKPCRSIYGESCDFCSSCGAKKIFDDGASVERHDQLIKNGDKEKWIELIATPIKDKDGKVIAVLELAVDVTERKLLQTKLADYSQRLEEIVQKRTLQLINTQEELIKAERLAGIGELAGMIGHDLRNPLTGIKNAAYFLKKKGASISKEQSDDMLEAINKCVDYSNKIINDLLDYSREIHLDKHESSPKSLVNDSLIMLQVPENVEIQNQLSGNLQISVDWEKMQRVFSNLIKNAIEAMPLGGRITIKDQMIDGKLEISIADTGTGIPAKFLPNLFSPLHTTKPQGMGFGLAICKRLVEAHGGTITVETSEGKGTTFKLKLPLTQESILGGEDVWIKMQESSLSMMTKT